MEERFEEPMITRTIKYLPVVVVEVMDRHCLATSVLCLANQSEARYCNSFQLTHRPRGNHTQSIASKLWRPKGRQDIIITVLTT